ncbi:MAG: hypothetical protein ACXAC5_16815 [Promethearchaeota archaeon]|jgi:hypothetical protein
MTKVQSELFRNLNAFQTFYNNNISLFEYRIEAERDKFVRFLARKLQNLARQKDLAKNLALNQNNWKVLLKDSIDSIETLKKNEKLTIKQILNKSLKDKEIEKIAFILSKLETKVLIEIFGESFKLHTKRYVKWGWDFYDYIKKNILIDYFKQPTRSFIYKFHPKLDLDYFKVINSVEKAYWFGFLLADGSLSFSKGNKVLTIELKATDGIILKNFIRAIGYNPKYVRYYKKILYNDKGQKRIKRTFRVRFTNNQFCNNLIRHGFIIGKKSSLIRFPNLKKREYILACLLGFFDGDGSHVGTPTIYTQSRAFLGDIVSNLQALEFSKDFKIKKKLDRRPNTSISYYLGLGGRVFNEMLEVFSNSLPRKRKKYLVGESMKSFRRGQWAKNLAGTDNKRKKTEFSKEKLTELRQTLSYKEIAQLHYEIYKTKISLNVIYYWCKKWGIENLDLLSHSKSKKLKFSKTKLIELRQSLSFKKIADLHYKVYKTKIGVNTIQYWCKKWGIK